MRSVYHKGFAAFSVVFAAAGLAISSYIFLAFAHADGETSGDLRVSFLDIGQGDSILIQPPNGNSMLIDSGPSGGKVLVQASKVKSFFDKNIDVALMTHGDADHIGSMLDVFRKYSVSAFVNPGVDTDTKLYKNLIEYSGSNIPQNFIAMAGMRFMVDADHGIYFKILMPNFLMEIDSYYECVKHEKQKETIKSAQNSRSKSKQGSIKKLKSTKPSVCPKKLALETNQNSIVGELVYGSTTFMLTGDSPVDAEHFLIEHSDHAQGVPKDSGTKIDMGPGKDSPSEFSREFFAARINVLKLGHHGSKTSTSEEFLDFIRPDFTVISVGKDNRYGHPNAETMQRLDVYSKNETASETAAKPAFKILRTDELGTVTLISDGFGISID